MYATVRRYEGATNATEAGRQVRETFLPVISVIRGTVAYYGVDVGSWNFAQRFSGTKWAPRI